MADGYTMLECFPFDSSPEVEYDEWGYPRYDRAADARVLRETFAKFFSDGVFPSPGTALAISKGKGLSVDIAPGAAVLNGAMGGVYDAPLNVVLDSEPPKGKVCYGIMLRYDNRRTHRGLFVRVAKSEPGPSPTPPEPESGPDVRELRLGHATVPSGASDLSGATLVNEKGLACCPYAAPFEEIDMEAVVIDARAEATKALHKFGADADASMARLQESIRENMELIESALDGTAAGHLQSQIDDLAESTINERSINAKHFEMARESPDAPAKLSLAAGSVGPRELRGSIGVSGGLAPYDSLIGLARDIAIVRFNVTFNELVASQKMSSAIVWEFPDDVNAGTTAWDAVKKAYYVEVG